MSSFVATHVIQTGTRRTYVHAEPGSDPGSLILYTEDEWAACESADWEYDAEEGLQFQGSTSQPICHGASLETFEACRWTRNDGWNDYGTRGCRRCGKPLAYPGALYCGAACCARLEAGDRNE